MLTQNLPSSFQKKFWCPDKKFEPKQPVFLSAKGVFETEPMFDSYNDCFKLF